MAHSSHGTDPQHSRNSAPESVYQGDREGKTPAPNPDDPLDLQVIPPRGGDGEGDGDGEQ